MAKFCGVIGFSVQEETAPGVWMDDITEHVYTGDVLQNYKNERTRDKVNDNIDINVRISILADPFATENFHAIKYVVFMGNKWKITSVDVQYPRLILTLGGLYV